MRLHGVLSYLRTIFLRFFLDAYMDSFLRGHVEGFAALGVALVLLYDNRQSAVAEGGHRKRWAQRWTRVGVENAPLSFE